MLREGGIFPKLAHHRAKGDGAEISGHDMEDPDWITEYQVVIWSLVNQI